MTPSNLELGRGQQLYRKARQLIPGGTQLLSKRPEMLAPDIWPAYYSRAKGARVWDLEGREYLDMSLMAVGAAILGYADEEVDGAVQEAVRSGVNTTLNCPEEVELAELLVDLHPWAQMVRYARGGGEAMAMAVRIARAHTKKDLVLFSGYHGWGDWYLAANLGGEDSLDGHLMPGLEPAGVPRGLSGTAIPFHLENLAGLKKAISGRENRIAAIVIEPARGEEAPLQNLLALKNLAGELGAVLIFDEITSAFRMNAGGIHLRYGVTPDMAVFAKAMANGYAMSAVVGTESVMQAAQSTFLSSTNWTERIGPVAALATIQKYQRENVARHLAQIGESVKGQWRALAQKHDLPILVSGLPSLCHFAFADDPGGWRSTLFTIEMLKRGILACRQFKPSYSHSNDDVEVYARVVDEVFGLLAQTDSRELLQTPAAHQGFYRLTRE